MADPTESTETAVSISPTIAVMRKHLGDEVVRLRLALLRSMIAVGNSDNEILEKTDWDREAFEILRQELYRMELVQVRRPTEEVYADYMMRQQGCIKDLNCLIGRLMSATEIVVKDNGDEEKVPAVKHATAVVGAAKAKADIYDRVVQRGQDLGLLHRAPERKEIVAGVTVAHVSTRDLRGSVAKEIASFEKLLRRHGDIELAEAEVVKPVSRRTTGRAERARKIAGRGVDRARAAHQRVQGEVRVKREKGIRPPPSS